MPSPKKVIVIEGLIGAGKTSLAVELGEELGPNTLVLLEPDEKEEANPYLADYYEDPARWSFVLQVHQLQARYRMHLHAQWHAMQGYGHAILDRSVQGDTAFARLQLEQGLMTQREFNTYRSLYHAMTASVLLPTLCVRVLVAPQTCAGRIQKRMQAETGRECENAIDLNYLINLEREIDHMVGVLRAQGVAVVDMPWDTDRSTTLDRQPAVKGLAARIEGLVSPDPFLDLHRRTL